ncbi:nucleoside hydrolase [Bradyrhizobium sp. STM 3557]|uniref:nucleoside hydrolase n=1 Tax=Bradyrhizobium sp. STM 3557 TaxID=578920 RepID=UPI0038904C41
MNNTIAHGRMTAVTYHIDTDMGVDDSLALMVADALLPDISAISCVFGNVPAAIAIRNVLLVRELLGRSSRWRVLGGADGVANREQLNVRHVHGDDGLGGATRNVDPAILERISHAKIANLEDARFDSADGKPKQAVTIIGLGPATNIPKLVALYGSTNVVKIVLMAGSFFDIGNITPDAEFNALADPDGLKETLEIGVPVTMVPLDVCRKVQLSRTAMQDYGRKSKAAIAKLLTDAHMTYMDFYQDWEGIDGCFPHDTVTVLATVHPEHFFSLRGVVTIDRTGRTTFERDENSHVEIFTGGNLKWVRETIKTLLS